MLRLGPDAVEDAVLTLLAVCRLPSSLLVINCLQDVCRIILRLMQASPNACPLHAGDAPENADAAEKSSKGKGKGKQLYSRKGQKHHGSSHPKAAKKARLQ